MIKLLWIKINMETYI